MKRFSVIFLLLLCLVCIVGVPAAAQEVYDNYTYDALTGETDLEPQAYAAQQVIDAATLGVESLNSPQDLIYSAERERFYLSDSGNNRVLILDGNWQVVQTIAEFTDENGQPTALQNPHGLYLTDAGELYVADTGSSRIAVFTADGTYLRQYGRPESALIDSTFVYSPVKVAATESGKMFVISENEIKGLLQIQRDGSFSGFYGAVQTVPNLAETFWRTIATAQQLSWMSQTVPTNYSGLDLDDEGFVYTTVSAVDEDSGYDTSLFVRRLNPMGNDVLERDSWLPVVGDYGTVTGNLSRLCDVCVKENGIYSVLGQEYCRVYTYDANGNLLFTFGAEGEAVGQLKTPVALTALPNDCYAVVDAGRDQIVCYSPTTYGQTVLAATAAFYNREYETSEQLFREALQYSTKSDIAYVGVGRAYLRNQKYKEAMQAFRLGNNASLYSEALVYYRKELGRKLFPWLLAGAAVLIVGISVLRAVRRRRGIHHLAAADAPCTLAGNLYYGFFVIFHPFKGFWELKRERRKTGGAAAVFVAVLTLLSVLTPQITAYLFNTGDARTVSAWVQLAKICLPFAVWCIGNWCVTTLMDGEGTIGQIATMTAYALIPLIFSRVAMVLCSYVLTYDEQMIYTLIEVIGWLWFAFLLFAGMMTVHQFSGGKTLLTVLLAVVAAVIILLLVLVMADLFGKLVGFISVLFREWKLRW